MGWQGTRISSSHLWSPRELGHVARGMLSMGAELEGVFVVWPEEALQMSGQHTLWDSNLHEGLAWREQAE